MWWAMERTPAPGPSRTDTRRGLLFIAGAALIPAFLGAAQAIARVSLSRERTMGWEDVAFQSLDWLFLGGLSVIPYYVSRRFPLHSGRWKRAAAAHSAGAIVYWFGWAWLGIGLAMVLHSYLARGPFHVALLNWLLTSLPFAAIVYLMAAGSVYAFEYFREAQERERIAIQLTAQLAEARLNALRMQLNPHFIFNSLNAITVLVREQDTRGAARMLELLGDMLHQVLRNDRPHRVPLDEELEFVRRYLEIESVRFSDRLRIEWTVDERARTALVPSFVLQPLAENAIRHGVARRAGAGLVTIDVAVRGDRLRLAISDDGAGVDERARDNGGVGLANTRERLRTMYGDLATLTVRGRPQGGTEAVVELPLQSAP